MAPFRSHNILVRQMHPRHVEWTRTLVRETYPPHKKTISAWLIPDGLNINRRLWIRVPVKRGVKRAFTVDDVDTNLWIDAGRGSGSAVVDNSSLVLNVRRFPLDEPTDMRYTYTIVVTTQRTAGGLIHCENDIINNLIPDLSKPWRGNILVLRHGRTEGRPLINMTDGDEAIVEAILRKVLRDGLVGDEDLGGKDEEVEDDTNSE